MKVLLFAAVLALVTASHALAASVLIDFEGPTSFASIDQFYNGGTDTEGASGPNLGVSFGLDDLGLKNDELGPYFSNAPSPIGAMAPVGLGLETAMNVVAGFTELSFYYSSPSDVTGGVLVWSGLNGTGNLLASINLTANSESEGLDRYGVWQQLSGSGWAEVAHSATFFNSVGFAGFDNVAITTLPEPASMLLLGLGVVGLVPLYRRRRGAQIN